jgi:hypothetical protein
MCHGIYKEVHTLRENQNKKPENRQIVHGYQGKH